MRAAYYEAFGGPIRICDLPCPSPAPDGVVVRVEATGICRSDWHGWLGHDPDVHLPHVPGHELAGVVEAVGADVKGWRPGDRVTVPFVCGCGGCPQCQTGNQQVCDHQKQPGFTHWGSFAEYVALRYADQNLVALPENVDSVAAASLGCRFVTSFRAVLAQGRLQPGEWLAVHGCGGVGLAAIMIGAAVGAQVVAVDIRATRSPSSAPASLAPRATRSHPWRRSDTVGARHHRGQRRHANRPMPTEPSQSTNPTKPESRAPTDTRGARRATESAEALGSTKELYPQVRPPVLLPDSSERTTSRSVLFPLPPQRTGCTFTAVSSVGFGPVLGEANHTANLTTPSVPSDPDRAFNLRP
jgi:hypothetical protein